jgi:hypothetical protein
VNTADQDNDLFRTGPSWDRARRVSDQVTLHILMHVPPGDSIPDWNGPQPWIAVRLSDGTSDGNLYPTKKDAVRHQLHENQCAYLTIPPDGMTVRQAHSYLKYTQQMYENGMRLADPDLQVQTPVRAETNRETLQHMRKYTRGR